MLVSWVSVNHAGIMDQVVVAVGPLKHCIGLIGHTVRLITTSDPIGLNWDHIGPHRTLSDHIGLKQHHIGRIGRNADRRRARN